MSDNTNLDFDINDILDNILRGKNGGDTQKSAAVPQVLSAAGTEPPPENTAAHDTAEEDISENNIEFSRQFRGYNLRETDEYIKTLTADYNRKCAECEKLRIANKAYKEQAEAVSSAIISAELTAKQIISNAKAEAKRIEGGVYSPGDGPWLAGTEVTHAGTN